MPKRVRSNYAADVHLFRFLTKEDGVAVNHVGATFTLSPGQTAEVHDGFLDTSGARSLIAEGIISVLDGDDQPAPDEAPPGEQPPDSAPAPESTLAEQAAPDETRRRKRAAGGE